MTQRTQCRGCPWRTPDDPELPFTEETFAAARRGEEFVCHERMGPCPGAVRWAKENP